MKISRAAAGVSFFGAMAIGVAMAGLFAADAVVAVAEPPPSQVTVTYKLAPVPAVENVHVEAEDLLGTWTGTWDHDDVPCTLEIKRVDGNRFYGTLKEGEAVVNFEGTFEGNLRRVFFRETKVMKLGIYGEWSLGTNSGGFSADGRTLTGTGVDKWGTYNFKLTKE